MPPNAAKQKQEVTPTLMWSKEKTMRASTVKPGKGTGSLLVSDGISQLSVWRLFIIALCLAGVCELLDHNKTGCKWHSGRKQNQISQHQETQPQATGITQQCDDVPSNLISGFRSIDEDLQGQTFLSWLLHTNSEQKEKSCQTTPPTRQHVLPGADISLESWKKFECFNRRTLTAGVHNLFSMLLRASSAQETTTAHFRHTGNSSHHQSVWDIILCPKLAWIPDYRRVICNKWLYSSLFWDLRYKLQRVTEHVVTELKSLYYNYFN